MTTAAQNRSEPVDRRKPGSKHHVITDAGGIPLTTALTGGNRHDLTQLMPLVDKIPDGSGLGARRRVVEQTIALLHWLRRPHIRWEIRNDIHEAFLTLACAITCWRRLHRSKSWSC